MTTEVIQYLNEDGKLKSGLKTDLNESQLKELHKYMVLTRVYDDRGLKLQRQGRVGFYIGCKGQEATQIGSAYAMENTDWIVPAYREPGILFMRGIPIQKLICQMIGNSGEETLGRQMPCHYTFRAANYGSISSPLATQIPHAVGIAFAAKYLKHNMVTLVFFGDGASSEGDFHVSMNFAAVFKTPCVLICQNNQYAISVPIKKQMACENIAIKASGYGMPGVKVDGNDVLAMYHVTKESVNRARNGDGPTLIEAFTYRLGPHSSSDDDLRYRSKEELDEWTRKEPISRLEKFLLKEKIFNEDDIKNVWEWSQNELSDAIKAAEKIGPPSLRSLFEDVYKEMPPNLQEQMHYLIEEQMRLGASEDDREAFPL